MSFFFAFALFARLVGEFSAFFDVGDTNKPCYGLHNIVFEIIINFKSAGIPFKMHWRGGTNNGIPNGFS